MKLSSPIFRRCLWCAFLPAILALLFACLYIPAASTVGHVRLVVTFGVAFILALLAALWASGPLIRRIDRLRSFAENLTDAGSPAALALAGAEDEVGRLARTLSRASRQWHELLKRLELESARREAILKSMTEGVLAVDKDLRIIFCNDSLARLLGATLPVAPRLPLLDIERDPGLTEILARVLASQQPQKRTLQLATTDGRVFEVNAMPLAEPSPPGAIAILHDITNLERLERVRKDFVANVSHELRTPLTAIQGYAETLLDGALEDPGAARKFVEVILAHAIRLNNIASDLLALSELEFERVQPEPEQIEVRPAVEAAMRAVEPEARLRQVHLVPGELEEFSILGARMRLEQALINLLDNAVKFNRPGGTVRVEAGHLDAQSVYISVQDDGIGIPSEDLLRIFERFYRVDKARSREVGGTGLGLSIVKHVVERMHGTVKAESRLGKGSTFTVVLPSSPPLG